MNDERYQCYYIDASTGIRCCNKQPSCWCSDDHKDKWQAVNYVDKRGRQVHQLPTTEIKRRLLELGRVVTLDDKTDKTSGQMLIIPKSENKQTSMGNILDH